MIVRDAHLRFLGLRQQTRRARRSRRSLTRVGVSAPSEPWREAAVAEAGLRSLDCCHPAPSELMPHHAAPVPHDRAERRPDAGQCPAEL